MKNIILLSFSVLIGMSSISCKQNNATENSTNVKTKEASFSKMQTKEDPFCVKIDTLPKSDYYQMNIDTFLMYHQLVKINDKLLDSKFSKETKDFISQKENYFMHYPYKGNAVAIKKIQINKDITAVFYAYLFQSEIIQPRIEIQTFNDKSENIDKMIVASTFSSECSGYREFCINQNILDIYDHYYCDEGKLDHNQKYKFMINDKGKFINKS
ncbi:hypothetical protein HZP98_18115 [Elizabethkingia anophelis]|nr:hypothetical protein [Elizabethkingia anophelis]MCT3953940.1 hypothetical protein [Elizabethkingia anophelis]MCT3957483.1 hypothetical protein [Elizabethkingia anophelis]MCT3989412.1 hypothetical protein [Elizabethkingia anophelis]MCT4067610.1 hypothetical protein [Elizabethkingia anophelis]